MSLSEGSTDRLLQEIVCSLQVMHGIDRFFMVEIKLKTEAWTYLRPLQTQEDNQSSAFLCSDSSDAMVPVVN